MEVIGPSTGPLRSPEQVATLATLGGPSFPISVSAGCLYPHPGYTLASFAALSKKTSAWVSSPETLTQSVAGPRRQPHFSAPGVGVGGGGRCVACFLRPCYSKCGRWGSSSIWALVSNADSEAAALTCDVRICILAPHVIPAHIRAKSETSCVGWSLLAAVALTAKVPREILWVFSYLHWVGQ